MDLASKKVGKYILGNLVGRGSFAYVYLSLDTDTKNKLACKVVPKDQMIDHDMYLRFEQEIRILQQINHPSITQLYDILQDDKNYYVFIEYCPNGELFKYIIENKKLGEENAKTIFKEIIAGLAYVHSLNIAHRDLKPENILLSETNHIKITDFGFSRYVGENGLVKTSCGSPCYASPECISGEQYDGIKSDMWSIGVILFAMVTGMLPWTKRNKNALFKQIQQAKYRMPQNISPECQDLISKLINPDPTKRLSAQEVYNHPWLEDIPYIPAAYGSESYVSLKKIDQFFQVDVSDDDSNDDDIEPVMITSRSENYKTIYSYISDNSKYERSGFSSHSVLNKRKSKLSKKIIIPTTHKSTIKTRPGLKKVIPKRSLV